MNTLDALKAQFLSFIGTLTSTPLKIDWTLNTDDQKQQFGDITCNAALVLAKELKRSPRDVATEITTNFSHPALKKIEIAGPGFLNIFLTNETFQHLACELKDQKGNFFKHPTQEKINIEFVSANPTGPLHLGHGRGGIIGDVLANVLSFLGTSVTKEHYINDAGSQMNKLGMSLAIRCRQLTGEEIELPEDAYQGVYMIDLAKQCIKEHGEKVITRDEQFFITYAYTHLLQLLKDTVQDYGISFDVWFSEKTLHTAAIEKALAVLEENGKTYVHEGAVWFRSTEYGDDKDRVLKKADGDYTYAAADAAYLLNKANRGFTKLIFVLGQDHHSYPKRLDGMRQGLGLHHVKLECIIYQLVSLKEDGEQLRMSKRAGRIVGLRDITKEVGKDVARFFYLNRKADAHLEFDIALALKKTEENPVYYLQYAYVRTKAVLDKAKEIEDLQGITTQDAAGIGLQEHLLLKKIASLKPLLEDISTNYQVHLLTYYLLELAQLFHAYYHNNRIIDSSNIAQSRARLLMTGLVKQTLRTGLQLIGITQPDVM